MTTDPYADIRRLMLQTGTMPGEAEGTGGNPASFAWYDTTLPEAFRGKFSNVNPLSDGLYEVNMQAPGGDKYDLLRAIYSADPSGALTMQGDPSAYRRETSLKSNAKDMGEAAAMMALYLGGAAGLEGLIAAPAAGAGGAAGAAGGAAAGGVGTLGTIAPSAAVGSAALPSVASMAAPAMALPSLGTAAGAGAAASSLIPGISNSALMSLGGNLLGAGLQQYGINKATDAQQAGISQSNDLMREMFNITRQDNAPLVGLRNDALAQIKTLLADPSSVSQQPGYQFGLNEGRKQLDNRAAASGGYYSGQQLKAAQQYGQDYAGTKLDSALNRLTTVAGLGQVGANNNQSAQQQTTGALSQNALSSGNVRGSGYGASSNAWNSAIGNVLNGMQFEDLLKRVGGP